MDPITLSFIGSALTSSMGLSAQGVVSFINGYYGRKLERERMDHNLRIEAERIRAIIESKREEVRHEEKMFEKTRIKELELQALEFEYQKLLADYSANLELESSIRGLYMKLSS